MTSATVVDSSTTEPIKAENGTANEAEKSKAEEAAQDAPSPKKKAPPKVRKTNWEQDVVYLYQFPRAPTVPSVSAYCLKVENYLRMNEIKYEVSSSVQSFLPCCLLPLWKSWTGN